ncbi:DNA-binding transcriptional regulator, MarR family [Paenibacillus tianmuensis]|uniref:DNA-binding transcriptional regulator, MarR family n=1 Tax=Paenibacillus tianmuensis TaxID=624147 RepID=A0A1G4TDK7_9BACL|nr:MarR family transcriptional regulator [Paenibacillus tianmuensis]SCW79492.1 DNA-binding transcriptional regulator, MarR family [Paenibacillus tianmuensis]
MQPDQPGELENALSHLQCVLIARRTRVNPEQLTWAQYDILEILRIRGPMMPSLIGETLGMSRPATSKNLRVLKDKQLIEQTAREEDRREQTTSLTDSGRIFLERAAQSRREAAEIAASVLTPGEQSIFAELCQKVTAALDNKQSRSV